MAAHHDHDHDEVGNALASHRGVVEIHDLHVWEVTSGFPALAAHVVVAADDDCHACRRELQALLRELQALLRERFAIRHTTLQVDHESWQQPIEIQPLPRGN